MPQTSVENIMNMMNFFIFSVSMLTLITAKVHWQLEQSIIEIGQQLLLGCETTTIDKRNLSRQWTGGAFNDLLCFNGIPADPNKYEETIDPPRKFLLHIKHISESDLECPYSCRIGFEFEEKILIINETNFRSLPNRNTSVVKYEKVNKSFSLHADFRNVFPKPKCSIKVKGETLNLTMKHEVKSRVFYNVSLGLESTEELHDCHNDTMYIHCMFGDKEYVSTLKHTDLCQEYLESALLEEYLSVIILFPVLLIMMFGILWYRNRKRHNESNTKYTGQYQETPTSETFEDNMEVKCEDVPNGQISDRTINVQDCNGNIRDDSKPKELQWKDIEMEIEK